MNNIAFPHRLMNSLARWLLPGVVGCVQCGQVWAADNSAVAIALQPFVEAKTLAGAVTLVASQDRILNLEAFGFADVSARKPMTVDALFWIASQSKPMTATALMMLVDEGRVSISDPVEKYLPEFKGQMVVSEQDQDHVVLKKISRPITIRDVLSHTSGLPFASRVEPKIDLHPLREAVISYALTPLKNNPGARYDYSNAGINTAGRIIEVVSGVAYEDFMEQRLFKPLGMTDTTFWPSEDQLKRLAKSYKPDAANTGLEVTWINQLTYPLSDRRRGPSPAGGFFSTAQDVARFCQMILHHGMFEGRRLLTEAAIREMTSKQTGEAIKESYGLGWTTGNDWCGHGGAYATDMSIDWRRGLITVFMVQHAGFPGNGGQSGQVFKKTAAAAFGNR